MTMVLGIVTHYDVAKFVDIASPACSGSGLRFLYSELSAFHTQNVIHNDCC